MEIIIQKETPRNYPEVQELLRACFNREGEGNLVNALRSNGRTILFLVAIQNGEVAGHVMFTPVTTSPLSTTTGLGLAPLAVKPKYQKQGIGAKLVEEGLRMCAELG